MSFGNFLLGVAEGLDRGVEAGDRIKGAMDRKKVRDTGKQVASDNKLMEQMASTGTDRVRNPGAGANPVQIAPMDPSKIAPPTTMQQHMPAPDPQRAPPMLARSPSLQPEYNPAQRLGAQAPTFDVRFPAGVAANYGVTGAPYIDGQYPPQQPY